MRPMSLPGISPTGPACRAWPSTAGPADRMPLVIEAAPRLSLVAGPWRARRCVGRGCRSIASREERGRMGRHRRGTARCLAVGADFENETGGKSPARRRLI